MRQLQPDEIEAFIATIGHTPKTVITVHLVRNNLADVYLAGEPHDFRAAVVSARADPAEPTAFGDDAAAIWQIFSQLDGWRVINLEPYVAPAVAGHLKQSMGVDVRFYGDYYYHLTQTATIASSIEESVNIRLLTPDDLSLCETAEDELQPRSYGTLKRTLEEGISAGAIVDGQLVAMGESHRGDRHLNIGVFTRDDHRKQGFSTAITSVICATAQQLHLIPVWSTGEDNFASQRVAEKAGFEKVADRLYIIPMRH